MCPGGSPGQSSTGPCRMRPPTCQTCPSTSAWDSKVPLGCPPAGGTRGVSYLPEQGAVDAG